MTKKDLFKLLQENLTLEIKIENTRVDGRYVNYFKSQNKLVIKFDDMEITNIVLPESFNK